MSPEVGSTSREAVVRRGGRLDQSPGSGLGLAIVQEVAEDYGWDLTLTTSPLGDLAATIAPAADGSREPIPG